MKLLEHHYSTFLSQMPSIKEAIPVDVTEIADWYYKEAEIPILDFRAQFPTLASPWAIAVYEYRFPAYYHSQDEKTGAWKDVPFHNLAGRNLLCLICQQRIEDQLYTSPNESENEILGLIAGQYPGERVAFRQDILMFVGDKKAMRPLVSVVTFLNEDGAYLKQGMTNLVSGKRDIQDAMRNMIYPVYFAINLMHCRNVRTVDTQVNAKVAKNRRSAGKECLAWKRIVIDSMRKSARAAAQAGKGNSVGLALRIARGHWKDYTAGKGLFGRLHGRFWWDDVADGSLGRAYAVRQPEEVQL